MRALLLAAALGLAACSGAKTCTSDCDCTESTTDQKCVGEWICSAGACAYACKSVCNQGPFTCASNESCNGAFCSQKRSCPDAG